MLEKENLELQWQQVRKLAKRAYVKTLSFQTDEKSDIDKDKKSDEFDLNSLRNSFMNQKDIKELQDNILLLDSYREKNVNLICRILDNLRKYTNSLPSVSFIIDLFSILFY